MENSTSLMQEIDRILTNPSQHALKSFHSYLRNENISRSHLGGWALAKPCQIIPLAKIVVDNSMGLAVFNTLAKLPEFVEAVLAVRPLWLESHLGEAAANADGDSSTDHLLDCPALVSCFNSTDGTLHSRAVQLMQAAAAALADQPNEVNLRRLSELCNALSSNILGFFTEEILAGVSSHCKAICSSPNSNKNDIEILLAQDILAQLARAFQTPDTPSRGTLDTPPGARFSETCRKRVLKLFSDPNASTMLKITLLRLSVFCSQDRGSSPPVVREAIRLAYRIVTPVAEHVRRQWTERNFGLIEKFLSRLNRQALDLNVRIEGVVLCLLFIGADNEMPPILKKVASGVLFAFCDANTGYESAIATTNDEVIADILIRLCPSQASPDSSVPGQCASLTRMMLFIVEQCPPWCTNALNSLLKLHRAKIILKSLRRILHSSSILEGMVEFVRLGYVPEWWGSGATFGLSPESSEQRNCIGENVCLKSLLRLRSDVSVDFSSLLLIAAWQSSRPLQTPETCQQLLRRLKGASVTGPSSHCSYTAVQIMELKDDGSATVPEYQKLHACLKTESARRISLEYQLAQSGRLLEEEREASNALQQYLEAVERECSDQAKALRSAKADYQELLREADRRVQVTEAKFRQEEILYRADLLRRESDLEGELQQLGFTLERKDEELQREKLIRADLAREMDATSGQINHQMEELRRVVAEQDKALREADDLKMKLMVLLKGKF